MSLDQLLERDGHLFLDGAGVVDVTGDVEKLGAGVPGTSEGGEPSSAPPANKQFLLQNKNKFCHQCLSIIEPYPSFSRTPLYRWAVNQNVVNFD